jgi:FKBP-type peptidyl-prolyl cis-trans isomerase FklB
MNKALLIFTVGMAFSAGYAQVKKPVTTTKPPTTATKPVAKTTTATAPIFKSNIDSVSYAVGVRIAQSLKAQGFDNLNMSLFQKAMNDIATTKPPALADAAITECLGQFQQKVNAGKESIQQKENAAKAKIARQEGAVFMEANAKKPGVISLPSGVQYEMITNGPATNPKPKVSDKIKFHYTGYFINGNKFQSSLDGGTPVVYPLGQLIRGWQDAIQLMTVGSKWKLYVPADLAYGDNGPPDIGPGATLIFDVELISIEN